MLDLSSLKTGDIVLFSGRCKVARAIQLLTWCKWSHVGMIIIDDKYNTPLVYESTHNDRVPGLDLGRKTQGVQVVKLSDRLEGYKGDMAIQKLSGCNITKLNLERFNYFRKESVGVLFEEDLLEAFLSMIKWIGNYSDFTTRFCTEHVGGCWSALGILPDDYNVHKLTPADFAKQRIKLNSGRLESPFLVKLFKG